MHYNLIRYGLVLEIHKQVKFVLIFMKAAQNSSSGNCLQGQHEYFKKNFSIKPIISACETGLLACRPLFYFKHCTSGKHCLKL